MSQAAPGKSAARLRAARPNGGIQNGHRQPRLVAPQGLGPWLGAADNSGILSLQELRVGTGPAAAMTATRPEHRYPACWEIPPPGFCLLWRARKPALPPPQCPGKHTGGLFQKDTTAPGPPAPAFHRPRPRAERVEKVKNCSNLVLCLDYRKISDSGLKPTPSGLLEGDFFIRKKH